MTSRKTSIGFRLRKHRNLMGYTIRQAAQQAKIAPIRISQWERDIRKPSIDNIVRLAVVYWVMVDELVYDLRQEAVREMDGTTANGGHVKKAKEKPP